MQRAAALALVGLCGCLETQFAPGDAAAEAVQGEVSGDVADLAAAEASTACPGAASCACAKDTECSSGACLATSEAPKCAATCGNGAPCAAGFVCGKAQVVDAAGKVVEREGLCLPRWPTLCTPCTASSQCKAPGDTQAACVDATLSAGAQGWYCAPSCAGDGDCPDGHACQETATVDGGKAKHCLPKAGVCACSPAAFAQKATTTCSKTTVGAGTCTGKRQCGGAGLSACDAAAPAPESCNGKDDDCDGQTDEPPGPAGSATPVCDDSNPCSDDSCSGAAGCVHTPNTVTCTDADPCTTDGQCDQGKCVGSGFACDDGQPCTLDACDKTSGACSHLAADATACDDADACTVGEQCTVGSCGGGQAKACDDGNACTEDLCNTGTGCVALATAATCSDADACTDDTCNAGACKGIPHGCDDGWGCTQDACDSKKGCTFTPVPGCDLVAVPYAIGLACSDPAIEKWRLLPTALADLPGKPAVRWQLDATPVLLPAQPTACALNANNGKNLQCQPGESAHVTTADSPKLDASVVTKGTPLAVRFESAGQWGAGWKAEVLASTDDAIWIPLGAVAASGSTWQKVNLPATAFATTKFRVRLRLQSADCSEAPLATGWFVRKFTVATDPCANGGGCHVDANCSASDTGSAVCTCKPGYSGNGKACQDVDECKSNNGGCAQGAVCTNKPGSFTCGCPDGFAGDGKVCTDVDECLSQQDDCAADADCANFKGGYLCKCKPGFTGDGKNCQDVDECKQGSAKCDANATCSNTAGSFQCACKPGWVGDGKACQQLGSQQKPADSCLAILQANPQAASGPYFIKVANGSIQLHCDMASDGGGWMRIDYKQDVPLNSYVFNNQFQYLPIAFQTVLTAAQIQALQAVAKEGKQTYVADCLNFPHYFNGEEGHFGNAAGFKLSDGSETPFGKESYAPFTIVVSQDGCKTKAQKGLATPAQTLFVIKHAKVPVLGVKVKRDGTWDTPKLGTPLTKNPAWLR